MTLLHAKQFTITIEYLASLYNLVLDNGDDKNATKILDLYAKLKKEELIVSFTGHFSAGKSSMINALLGEDILPKSPIPTSGNIVEITSGKGFAKVFFNNDHPRVYRAPYDIELIKDYCKDNQSVRKIELSTSENILPKGCMIVDTPGIDAADDADRIMTESSLHLIDQLFYVMDYNHVQSEVNLYFLKQIQEKQIPFYVIINQIDKHNEAEIPFQTFNDSIKQTFEQWGINPEAIYYSSLIDDKAKHNEFNKIKDRLFGLLTSDKDRSNTIDHAVQQIIRDHKDYLEAVYDQKLALVSQIDVQADDAQNIEDVRLRLLEVNSRPKQLELDFQKDLNETLKNAYLMPATLRDHALLFLESQQKGFKVGLFASKKKTMEEMALRLDNFLEPLLKNIESAIQWRLRDKVIALLTKYDLANPELLQFTQQFSITYTADDIISNIKSGAKVNGDSVIHYTNDVSAHIKSKYKSQSLILWEKIRSEITMQTDERALVYEEQLDHLEKFAEQSQQVDLLKAQLQEAYLKLEQDGLAYPSQSLLDLIEDAIQTKDLLINPVDTDEVSIKADVIEEEVVHVEVKGSSGHSIQTVTQSIEETITTIEALPGFQTIIDDLQLKKEKLNNRTLTVALFGAFSAGKSSFANALLGEGLLPSSPNPTTAVINQISPITEEHEHGTVVIHLKAEQAMVTDIKSITKELAPPETDLAGYMDWIKINKLDQDNALDKIYQAYLHAMITGYTEISEHLGQTLTITIEDFVDYITDETKACFIESVTLYYDCSLTRLGITLVDTPGADSVNARHTSVAFDYIKHADAILYVTYYNHALSRADKDFLMQLGRVKEAFQLDKMFFIINAADLAESDADLKLVIDYVEEQLLQLGIRFPKVFPISSKLSLDDKINQQQLNTQMQDFESNFYQFINDDLVTLSIQAALWDINRAFETLTNHIQTARLNGVEKEAYRNGLSKTQIRLEQSVNKADAMIYEERIIQRIERQLHYVEERLGIRFHDFFKDTFNPTTISESGRKAIQQLENSLKVLLDDTSYELLQELRAVSLRIEAFLNTLAEEVYQDLQDRTQAIDSKFILPMIEITNLETPTYEQAFLELDGQQFTKALRRFNGTKAFFEKNEKDDMKADLFEIIVPAIQQYIQGNQELMDQSYRRQWQALFKASQQQVKTNIHSYIENSLAMMTDTADINVLQGKQQVLAGIIDSK